MEREFSATTMADIEHLLASLSIKSADDTIYEMLERDVADIVSMCFTEAPSIYTANKTLKITFIKRQDDLNKRFYQLFESEKKLYEYLWGRVLFHIPSCHFLEICPLLDEYIDYAF
jgi:hypothetical protein